VFLGVLQVAPARTRRGGEAVTDPDFSSVLCGGAWRKRAATVHTGPKGFPALLWIFGGLFCNFKVFDVICV